LAVIAIPFQALKECNLIVPPLTRFIANQLRRCSKKYLQPFLFKPCGFNQIVHTAKHLGGFDYVRDSDWWQWMAKPVKRTQIRIALPERAEESHCGQQIARYQQFVGGPYRKALLHGEALAK
jgi:hypothetical protein